MHYNSLGIMNTLQFPTLCCEKCEHRIPVTMTRTALLFAGVALVAATALGGDGNVRRSARRIPGRYIVALESSADTATVATAVRNLKGARVWRTYERGIKGFEVELSDADAQALARDSRVQFVEEDATVSATTTVWGLD